MSSNHDKSNDTPKSCCTWPKILVTAVVLIVVGVLIWQFAPIDDAIDSVLPTFNNTGVSPSDPGTAPTPAPSAPNAGSGGSSDYDFIQCSDTDMSNNNCCNGLNSICDLGVDDVLYASVHNAMATFDDGFLFGHNHLHSLENALEAGYRGINLDVCNCGGTIEFCHGVCSLGARDVTTVFENINAFLDAHPTEVIALIFQVNNNADQPVDLNAFYSFITAIPDFFDKFYQHSNPLEEWPTLRESIDTNKRILSFQYGGDVCSGDPTSTDPPPCPAGLHNYFDYVISNPWQASNLAQLRQTSTSCLFSRTPNDIAGTTFFAMNNFVTPPSQSAAQSANAYNFAKNRMDTCSEMNDGLNVNFIYADFWATGDLPRLTQDHNQALAQARRRGRERRMMIRTGR